MQMRLQELENERDISPGRVMVGTELIGKEEMQRNYNQFISGSRTQKLMPVTSSSLTNQTIQMLGNQGSTERVVSKSTTNNPVGNLSALSQLQNFKNENKFKSDPKRKQHQSHTGRDMVNRSALGMVGSQSDANRIQISRSPDRSKNNTHMSMSSYLASGNNTLLQQQLQFNNSSYGSKGQTKGAVKQNPYNQSQI